MPSRETTRASASNRTKLWQSEDAAHHIHPFTEQSKLKARGARVITRGEGIYIWDSEGRRLLDGMAGLWCCQLGHGNQELAEAGYEALKQLAFYNTFFQTTHPNVVELSAALADIAPAGIDRFFFSSSGSEANDTAVKLIRYYWNLQGQPRKKIIIGRPYGYHGSTLAGASLSGLPHMHPQFDLPLPGFAHVALAPYWFGDGKGMEPEEFGLKAARTLEDKILELGPETVAAFIGEPVQGAGGLIIPPRSYWPEIAHICKKYDILLWSDEVICGFGRTGNWFGADTFEFEPDIITMAKGLSSGYVPISAAGLGQRLGTAIAEAPEELAHGYTYSGHPVAAAVALKTIEIMRRLDLVGERGRKTAAYLQQQWRTLADHPLVGEARGIGFLGALELVKNKATGERFAKETNAGIVCRDACFDVGLVMRSVRDTMILSPPLIITRTEIDELVRLARQCLDITAEKLGVA